MIVATLVEVSAALVASLVVQAPSPPQLPAAELAKSFGLELRPSVATDVDGVPIWVVDAATKRPVADALVVTAEEWQFYADHYCWVHDEPDAATMLRHLGKAYATDSEGRTRVATSNQTLCVFVWSGSRFGSSTIAIFDSDEHVVALSNHDLTVEVVDESGTPRAGVPVTVAKSSIEYVGAWHGVSAPDGRVVVPAIALEREAPTWTRPLPRRAVVTFDFPNTVAVERDLDAPVVEPVRLVLPKCGSVDFEFFDERGSPLTEKCAVHLDAARRATADSEVKPRDVCGHSIIVVIERGRLELPRVELGLDLSGWIDSRSTFHGFGAEALTRADEHRHVALHAEDDLVAVEGRATTEDGGPWSKIELDGCVVAGGRLKTNSDRCTTDDDGHFHFVVGRKDLDEALEEDAPVDGDDGSPATGACRLILSRWGPRRWEPWGSGRLSAFGAANLSTAPRHRDRHSVDVGDVVLAVAPLLVRGRVVEARGAPFFGAHVSLKGEQVGKGDFAVVVPQETTSDENGDFELYGPAPEGPLALEVSGGPGSSRSLLPFVESAGPVAFDAGDRDLVVPLRSKSFVELPVAVDDAIEWTRLRLRHRETGTTPWPDAEPFDFVGAQRFVELELPPERAYDFRLSLADPWRGEVPLLDVPGVEVAEHSRVRDPRVVGVELRHLLVRHVLDVVDESGRPVEGRVSYLRVSDGTEVSAEQFSNGHVEFVTLPDTKNRLAIVAPRFQVAERSNVAGRERVTLKRGHPVRIALDPTVDIPPGLRILVSMSERPHFGDDDGTEVDESARWVEWKPGGSALFDVPGVGDRRVEVRAMRDGNSEECESLEPRPPTLHVADREDEQRFQLTLSSQEIASALAALKRNE